MVLRPVGVFGVMERESDKNFFVSISDRRASMLTALIIGWKKLDTTFTTTCWTMDRRLERDTARSLHHWSVTHWRIWSLSSIKAPAYIPNHWTSKTTFTISPSTRPRRSSKERSGTNLFYQIRTYQSYRWQLPNTPTPGNPGSYLGGGRSTHAGAAKACSTRRMRTSSTAIHLCFQIIRGRYRCGAMSAVLASELDKTSFSRSCAFPSYF